MVSKCSVVAIVLVILTLLNEGHALTCFDCSSVLDNKCGRTWEFSGTEGDKYKVQCEGNTVACRKLETTDSYKGELLVIRSCWNVTSVETLDDEFLDCKKMASIGKACYCNKDIDGGKPCNGSQPLTVSMALIVSAILAIRTFLF